MKFSRRQKAIAASVMTAAAVGVVATVSIVEPDKSSEKPAIGERPIRVRMIRTANRPTIAQRISRIEAARKEIPEKPSLLSDREDKLSEAAKKLAADLQKALDEEDFESLQQVIDDVMKSRNILLMRKAVAAGGWFGPKALPELTGLAAAISGLSSARGTGATGAGGGAPGLVGDLAGGEAGGAGGETGGEMELADLTPEEFEAELEDALFESMSAIEAKLGEIENLEDRAVLIAEYMKSASSENSLILLSGQLKTILDERIVLNAVVEIIENGGTPKAVESAKEVYEFETGGETYTGIEAAEQWLQENYTPPEE